MLNIKLNSRKNLPALWESHITVVVVSSYWVLHVVVVVHCRGNIVLMSDETGPEGRWTHPGKEGKLGSASWKKKCIQTKEKFNFRFRRYESEIGSVVSILG